MNTLSLQPQFGLNSRSNVGIDEFIKRQHINPRSRVLANRHVSDLKKLNELVNRASDIMRNHDENAHAPVTAIINDDESKETLALVTKERMQRNYNVILLNSDGVAGKERTNVSPRELGALLKKRSSSYSIYSIAEDYSALGEFNTDDFTRSWGFDDEFDVEVSVNAIKHVVLENGFGAIRKLEIKLRKVMERLITRSSIEGVDLTEDTILMEDIIDKLQEIHQRIKMDKTFYKLGEVRELVRLNR